MMLREAGQWSGEEAHFAEGANDQERLMLLLG